MTETMPPAGGADGSFGTPDNGLPEIHSALTTLDTLDARPVVEHVEVFETIHQSLQAALEEPEHG